MDDEQRPTPAEDKPRTDLSSIRDLPPPKPRPVREINVELLPWDQRTGVSAHDRLQAEKERRPSALQTAGKTLLGFAAFAAVLVGIYFAADALDDKSTPSAAWSKPGAPLVSPSPLNDE